MHGSEGLEHLQHVVRRSVHRDRVREHPVEGDDEGQRRIGARIALDDRRQARGDDRRGRQGGLRSNDGGRLESEPVRAREWAP